MTLVPRGYEYPAQAVSVEPFPSDLTSLVSPPPGLIEDTWPPTQLAYLGVYLSALECRTVVIESHYIDRDYINDLALFYSRSLRDYPNFCYRLHFFREGFDQERWNVMVTDISNLREHAEFLQGSYLGFCIIRPLPGSPIGRTVLSTFEAVTPSGLTRRFDPVREYNVHLAGFRLVVKGLAFQQQDQGVSACATTALWSAMHKIARMEKLAVPTPAQITEAASRYLLVEGRALPSEGLNIQQICEAIRAAGLQPLVIRSTSVEDDRAQLLSYLSSGFASVLAIQPVDGGPGHAVCAVGLKVGAIAPQVDPTLNYRDAATAIAAVYIHDDRLGPYATAELGPWTITGADGKPIIKTGLKIEWPDRAVVAEQSILRAIVVPVPAKVRMPISRMLALGLGLAQATGDLFNEFSKDVAVHCRYRLGTDYKGLAYEFGLTSEGLYMLNCETVLSCYIGVIEVSATAGPLFDVVLDATETRANPSILAFIHRNAFPTSHQAELGMIANKCGARLIW